MHQRAALLPRKYRPIELLVKSLVTMGGENQTTPWAAQRFMGGGGDHMRKRERARIEASGHQTSHVGHIDHQPGAYLIGNSAKTAPIHHARVSGEARDDHLRLVLAS